MARTDRPILVGPWRGEVGFESLYWLPFLDYCRERYKIESDRLIPISRGGASVWYRTPTGLELYSLRTPQQVRIANRLTHQRTKMLKQMEVDAWDRAVLEDAAAKLKLGRHHVLHPSVMYRAYEDFWEGRKGLDWFRRRTQLVRIPTPPLPDSLTLPKDFIAVRFYARPTFPWNDLTNSFVTETLKQLAAKQPVIVLSTDQFVDDHTDILPKDTIPNVHYLHQMTPLLPENNLAVLSAVLGRARGFVGTYGGVAQLAMRMGLGCVSVYQDWQGTAWAHKHLSEVVSAAQGTNWVVAKLMDIPLLQDVCPRMTVTANRAPSSAGAR